MASVHRVYGQYGLKIDWSPSSITPETYAHFSDFVGELIGGINHLLDFGFVRYFEAAVDVPGEVDQNYVIAYPRIARSCIHYNIIDGSQTTYLGARKGRYSFALYDKGGELLKRHARLIRGNLLRLEYRNRQRHAFSEMPTLSNPFSELLVADLRHAQLLSSQPQWHRFLDSCEEEGAQRTLQRYGNHQRRKFKRLLLQANASWFDADEIWAAWPDVVRVFSASTLGSFPP